jgi:hypothetical protein
MSVPASQRGTACRPSRSSGRAAEEIRLCAAATAQRRWAGSDCRLVESGKARSTAPPAPANLCWARAQHEPPRSAVETRSSTRFLALKLSPCNLRPAITTCSFAAQRRRAGIGAAGRPRRRARARARPAWQAVVCGGLQPSGLQGASTRATLPPPRATLPRAMLPPPRATLPPPRATLPRSPLPAARRRHYEWLLPRSTLSVGSGIEARARAESAQAEPLAPALAARATCRCTPRVPLVVVPSE